MKSRENMANLQFWVPNEFKQKFEQTAKEAGYPKWQTYAENLFTLAINGDIQISKPVLVKSNGGSNNE